ncbi:hypothetical protein [Hymenobacter arizonensis]|uniref:Uncharacterized protein n=1 Tax=Hymenobacter arizonensis TaxID=1227077 RepID=A0A1I6BN20_HYMAR|nr:hypothetical protein [Hymenobacter arizonensis]SFQ82323.1 hypothetical protein SAMN04515668_4786 [Hymenobacter arizonensis]
MTHYDPDFGFLFLRSGWQKARKEALRTPLTREWKDAVIAWVRQATVSEGLRSFLVPFQPYEDSVNHGPDAEFAESKTGLLALLTGDATKGLKRQLATLHFYRQNLAVFPERFIEPSPALFFSEPLVAALRHGPLDLRGELYESGPTIAYELEPECFYYAVSQEFAGEVIRHLPPPLPARKPHDLNLFLSLAHASAMGEVEMLVMDK